MKRHILTLCAGLGVLLASLATMPEVWAQSVSVPLTAPVEIPATLTMIPLIGDFLVSIQKWIPVILQVAGTFSVIASLTANQTDDKIVNYILKGINILGFNFGTAKNDPKVGVSTQ